MVIDLSHEQPASAVLPARQVDIRDTTSGAISMDDRKNTSRQGSAFSIRSRSGLRDTLINCEGRVRDIDWRLPDDEKSKAERW